MERSRHDLRPVVAASTAVALLLAFVAAASLPRPGGAMIQAGGASRATAESLGGDTGPARLRGEARRRLAPFRLRRSVMAVADLSPVGTDGGGRRDDQGVTELGGPFDGDPDLGWLAPAFRTDGFRAGMLQQLRRASQPRGVWIVAWAFADADGARRAYVALQRASGPPFRLRPWRETISRGGSGRAWETDRLCGPVVVRTQVEDDALSVTAARRLDARLATLFVGQGARCDALDGAAAVPTPEGTVS